MTFKIDFTWVNYWGDLQWPKMSVEWYSHYHKKFLSNSIGLIKHLLPLSWSSLSEICQFIIWLWLELIGHGFRSILQYRDQRRRPYSDGFLSTTGRDYIAVVLRLLALWAEYLYFFQKYSAFLPYKYFFKHMKCLPKKLSFLQKYCGILSNKWPSLYYVRA